MGVKWWSAEGCGCGLIQRMSGILEFFGENEQN
jgi:hypothetical protein